MPSRERTALFFILLLAVATMTLAADDDKDDKKKKKNLGSLRFEDGECPGYGFLGFCWQLCDWIEGREVNPLDATELFIVTLLEFNITSGDSMYVSCDPISGDIADYTTGEIKTNIQDINPMELSIKAPSASQTYTTNCTDYEDAGFCSPLCDYIVDRVDESDRYQMDENLSDAEKMEKMIQLEKEAKEDGKEFEDRLGMKVYLKWQFQIFSKTTDFVACLPETGDIVDFDDWDMLYMNIRDLVRDFAGYLDEAMPGRRFRP